ncbi:hypothetical protein AMTR_s00020p00243740 [Amborella trichopoda]|uniref:Uncharacterized protein n=1 Tax=Amborella trichopoda TaxID=13333 RepID=W1PV23_AMBTC|nr:hypothetical protein AMTR_s00020p00243740 [Amborella trichopoda]
MFGWIMGNTLRTLESVQCTEVVVKALRERIEKSKEEKEEGGVEEEAENLKAKNKGKGKTKATLKPTRSSSRFAATRLGNRSGVEELLLLKDDSEKEFELN